jgi:hypothetical protein
MMIGVAAGASIVNAVWAACSDDLEDPTITMSYCLAGESLAEVYEDTVVRRGSVTAWLSNGFRINWAETDTDQPYFLYIALKGGQYYVGNFLTATNTTNFTETDVPFRPEAGLFVSHCKAQSTSDTTQPHDELSIGAAIGSTNQRCQAMIDEDAQTTTDVGTGKEDDAIYQNISTAMAIEGVGGIVNTLANGWTMAMSDADPVAAFVWYLAMGSIGQPARKRTYGIPTSPVRQAGGWN